MRKTTTTRASAAKISQHDAIVLRAQQNADQQSALERAEADELAALEIEEYNDPATVRRRRIAELREQRRRRGLMASADPDLELRRTVHPDIAHALEQLDGEIGQAQSARPGNAPFDAHWGRAIIRHLLHSRDKMRLLHRLTDAEGLRRLGELQGELAEARKAALAKAGESRSQPLRGAWATPVTASENER